jgi:hypothetical protein
MKILMMAMLCLSIWTGFAVAGNWEPSEAQKAEAMRAAVAYFEMLDQKHFESAYAMLSPLSKATATEAQYGRFWEGNMQRAGKLVERNIRKFTWYPNGSDEGTGVTAAVDYDGAFVTSNVYCGYIALVEMPGGHFRLLRDDVTLATTGMIRKMPPSVRIQMFNRPGCRRFLTADE